MNEVKESKATETEQTKPKKKGCLKSCLIAIGILFIVSGAMVYFTSHPIRIPE